MRSLMMATVLLGLGTASATAQGVVVQTASRDLPSGKEDRTETSYVQNGMVRTDDVDDKGQVTGFSIIRDGAIWQVDLQDRTYKKFDKATVQQAAEELKMLMAGKGQMAKMPPQAQAMLKKMLAAMQSSEAAAKLPKRTWTDAGKTERAGGYTCHLWESRAEGKVDEQDCVTPWKSVEGGDQMVAAFEKVDALIKDLSSASPFPQLTKSLAAHDMEFAETHGLPVVVRHFSGGQPYREDVVKSVRKQAVAADKFEVPKGFKEVPALGNFGAMGGPGGA